MVAAARGRTATVQSLVAAGPDMNIQDEVSTAPQPEFHPHTCNHVLGCGNECCSYYRMVALHSLSHSNGEGLKLLRF